jgi:hypothetical protein
MTALIILAVATVAVCWPGAAAAQSPDLAVTAEPVPVLLTENIANGLTQRHIFQLLVSFQ